MFSLINDFLLSYKLSENLSGFLSNIIVFGIMLIFSYIAYLITNKYIMKILEKIIQKSKFKWDDILFKKKVFHSLGHIAPAIVILSFSSTFSVFNEGFKRFAISYIVLSIIFTINGILRTISDIYESDSKKYRPIKGFIQLIQIVLFSLGGILVLGILINKNFTYLLSGIGALTAVLLVIFKDTLLSLSAHVQLTANKMIRKGDWISMNEYGADGNVIEMTLNTIKVQNWDKTLVYIPTWALINSSFKNWKGMEQSGGRRIKRCIYIDFESIKLFDKDKIDNLKSKNYLSDFLNNFLKSMEIKHISNLTLFRKYLVYYIENNNKFNTKMTYIVRHLDYTEHGLPLEIYVFSKEKSWVEYEGVQSELFEYIYSVIEAFELKIYQLPSYDNFKNISLSN
jgi:miniconductance mechanosensitive channel